MSVVDTMMNMYRENTSPERMKNLFYCTLALFRRVKKIRDIKRSYSLTGGEEV